jgi:hypothetical protein
MRYINDPDELETELRKTRRGLRRAIDRLWIELRELQAALYRFFFPERW